METCSNCGLPSDDAREEVETLRRENEVLREQNFAMNKTISDWLAAGHAGRRSNFENVDPIPEDVIAQARKEVTEERFRAAVEAEKVRIKTRRTFWQRIFPFKITIERI